MIKIRTFIPNRLLSAPKEVETRVRIGQWERAGKPLPPPHAVKRMAIREAQDKKVRLFHGDSAVTLREVLRQVGGPAVFWLDGHYSGGRTAKGSTECPLFGELEAILPAAWPHILLIDDAHCFVGENDYPTIRKLRQYLENKGIEHTFFVKDNIIHIELR
ncbi:MAG: hypothetical protein LBN29_11540 [Mediterranea sp.]|jgi:hypothetical protein|nr:hypothetical protein [Mediterranea sp.]